AANDNLNLVGSGDTIERSTASGTAAFRLFDVASGGSLTLNDLTLQGGLASGNGVSAEGGALYYQGTLTLSRVILQNNIAHGSQSQAAGGGIYSAGSLTLQGCTIQNNQAIGGRYLYGLAGLGGGLYVAGGTASLTNVTLYSNSAQGGAGADGFRFYDDKRGLG